LTEPTQSVADIPDADLLQRAVRSSFPRTKNHQKKMPRYRYVMDTFALGSTYAAQLVKRFGFDPNEMV
jgi:hypothetical protein